MGLDLVVDRDTALAMHPDDVAISEEIAKGIDEPSFPTVRGMAIRRLLAKLALESGMPQPGPMARKLQEAKAAFNRVPTYPKARTAISAGEKALMGDVCDALNVSALVFERVALQDYRADLIAEGRLAP